MRLILSILFLCIAFENVSSKQLDKFYLNKLNTEVFPNSRYTAVQLIHDVYPYGNDNRDFWLEIPKETVIALDSLELFFEQKNKDIYYIESV